MAAKKIAVIGSSNTDMIIKIKELPKPGETIIGGKFATAAGGKGANQAVAAARAGGNVDFVSRVGSDMFGDNTIDGFAKDGLDVSNISRDDRDPSGVALIFVDEKGENSIAVASGANANLTPANIPDMEKIISQAGILLMQLEIPIETVERAAELAKAKNVKVILNPAPARPLSDDLLKNVSLITPNETEAEMLTGVNVRTVEDAEKAAQILIDKGVDTVIITMGSKGAFLYNRIYNELIPSRKVEAVDTTAAGDVFNGALTVALAEGKGIKDAVLFGNAAAAISVTRLGAQPSAPYRKEIISMLLNNTN
ncbi:MAG TPA: ribokinase [Ignavibacteriales bacterium]|nr:ribokinase [Ignavibacteriales bacterium]